METTPKKQLTLLQLCTLIKTTLEARFAMPVFWVSAEIASLNIRRGHCYISLVDKAPDAPDVKAEIRAMIWARNFQTIAQRFQQVTGAALAEQMQVLLCVKVTYNPAFGLSLVIEDIDPAFTVGRLQMEREQTLLKLSEEGVLQVNKQKKLAAVPQKIAVISAHDSKGYEDFLIKLRNHPLQHAFKIDLYPALLQGAKAASEMVDQLLRIFHSGIVYDAVCIIRGGGGNINLNCFNDYRLSRAVARFPIPILTGIGHTTNTSVVDMVAHTARNTPTDLADFIIDRTTAYEQLMMQQFSWIMAWAQEQCVSEKQEIKIQAQAIQWLVQNQFSGHKKHMYSLQISLAKEANQLVLNQKRSLQQIPIVLNNQIKTRLLNARYKNMEIPRFLSIFAMQHIHREQNKLELAQKTMELCDPVHILKRGFALVEKAGQVQTGVMHLQPGDEVIIQMNDGEVNTQIQKVKTSA